jgi:uncharacterized protein YyaL (SSP411 family)
MKHFNITAEGNWKQGANILYRKEDHSLTAVEQDDITHAKKKLFAARTYKKRPARDDKIITSWNGMVLQGLLDAYNALEEAHLLALALSNAYFIEKYLLQGNQLWHSYSKGQLGATGYLEDYAWVARAFISLYQVTFEAHWLYTAEKLVQYALAHFYDAAAGLFYFVKDSEATLIARCKEIFDHSIPSSNAVMGHNLLVLGTLLCEKTYTDTAKEMLCVMAPQINHAPLHLSNWACLYMLQLNPTVVVAIVGPAYKAWSQAMRKHAPSGTLFAGTLRESRLPVLVNKKMIASKTTIYVCHQGICQAPIHNVREALEQLAQIS